MHETTCAGTHSNLLIGVEPVVSSTCHRKEKVFLTDGATQHTGNKEYWHSCGGHGRT